jgi:hypothetical protein
MKIVNFNKPDESVKSVMLFYFGKYPKKTKPAKDITLPIRLWPKAKYYIRCTTKGNIGKNNLLYFRELFRGHQFELVEDAVSADMLFIHHENYNAFGGVVRECCVDFARALKEWKGPATVFYNDELFSGYYDLRDYIENRAKNENFLVKNPGILDKVRRKEDWTNVTLLMNENKITDWADEHVWDGPVKDQITVSYLSDIILYDLPTSGIRGKSEYEKKGVYVPLFTAERISVCDKLFNGNVDITFAGSRSDELKENIRGNGKYINNIELPNFLRKFDWTIYIGKGKQSSYLGATFYEPLLKGLPVFVWTETDKMKKVFGDLDCYFSNESDLKRLVEKWDMRDLFKEQVRRIFNSEVEDSPLEPIETETVTPSPEPVPEKKKIMSLF